MRTPLNAVCLGLSLLQEEIAKSLDYASVKAVEETIVTLDEEGKDVPDQKFEWFTLSNEILGNTQHAVEVLNDLLNYDKIESGTFSLELVKLSIWKLIETSVAEFRLAARKKKIELTLRFLQGELADDEEMSPSVARAEDMPRGVCAVGDSVRLTQVLRNLASNAIKFTPDGGSLKVRVEYDATEAHTRQTKPRQFRLAGGREVSLWQSGNVKVCVEDTGAGMNHDQLNMLFREGVQFNAGEQTGFLSLLPLLLLLPTSNALSHSQQLFCR